MSTENSEAENTQQVNVTQPLENEIIGTPYIPSEVHQDLPQLIKDVVGLYGNSRRQQDIAATGALVVTGATLFGIKGNYKGQAQYGRLYSFITAPPGSGKETVADLKNWANPLHKHLDVPVEEKQPEFKFVIPGNISFAKIIETVYYNKGNGITIESEADSLGGVLKQKWGGQISEFLRNNFHFEPFGHARKSGDWLEIDEPKFSLFLGGTPEQITGIVPNTNNGLFSRFFYYCYEQKSGWKKISNEEQSLDKRVYLREHGKKLIELHEFFNTYPCTFSITQEQKEMFDSIFESKYQSYVSFHGEHTNSVVFRHGHIAFRIAMILTAIRKWESENQETSIKCSDVDFKIALDLTTVYLKHAETVLDLLPKNTSKVIINKPKELFSLLPNEFFRRDAQKFAEALKVSPRTIDRYLEELVSGGHLEALRFGHYKKTTQ